MPESGDVKVDEEAQGQSHQLQICDHLGLMDWQKAFHRFDFDDQLAVDQQIDAVSTVKI